MYMHRLQARIGGSAKRLGPCSAVLAEEHPPCKPVSEGSLPVEISGMP